MCVCTCVHVLSWVCAGVLIGVCVCVCVFFVLFWFAWICFAFVFFFFFYWPVCFLKREKEGKELDGWGGRECLGDEEGERVQNILHEKKLFSI